MKKNYLYYLYIFPFVNSTIPLKLGFQSNRSLNSNNYVISPNLVTPIIKASPFYKYIIKKNLFISKNLFNILNIKINRKYLIK